MTVRRAIDSLVADAVLARRQGSGTYVAQPKMDVQARMTSFTEEMRQRGMIPGSRLIRAEQLLATPDVAAWLGISIHDRVHFVHRVRLADGVPMAVEKTWVAVDSAPTLISHGVPESMYQALADAGMVPTWGEDTIEANAASPSAYSVRGFFWPRSPSPLVRGTTWRWRCGTDWLTVLLTATNEPCAPRPSSGSCPPARPCRSWSWVPSARGRTC